MQLGAFNTLTTQLERVWPRVTMSSRKGMQQDSGDKAKEESSEVEGRGTAQQLVSTTSSSGWNGAMNRPPKALFIKAAIGVPSYRGAGRSSYWAKVCCPGSHSSSYCSLSSRRRGYLLG